MRGMSLLLAAATVAGCSTAPHQRSVYAENELRTALAGKVAQRPVSCLSSFRSGNMTVIDDGTILFREGGTVYRNDLNGGSCNQLASGHYALVTTSYGGGLCRGDIARVMDAGTGVSVGSCVMGDFVPYRAPRG